MAQKGAGAFDSDIAMDWLQGPVVADGERAVKATLDAVMAVPPGQEIDYDTGAKGRAAAEIVAIVFGHPDKGLDDAVRETALTHAGGLRRETGLAGRALDVLARVWSENSALNERWVEGDDASDWQDANSDLTNRLLLAKAG